MNPTSSREPEPSKWRGRLVVVLVLAPTVIAVMAIVGLAVWLLFFPPFSGT